ncbi:hypothetical protein GCM10007876_21120 [Litoribrevibacter albus]|uniref:Uncharacterized protein n=2 Tax=Litoribrevibacter albus TaxID=1473156 RepID=A0AA37W7Q0_9GAMM|nr:hypothetical protein GCM10007876_21120 [Litoribrevibacter albus]
MHECDTCNSVGFLKTNQQVVASKSEANYARDKVIQQMQREINKLRTVVVANDETGPTREMVYPENGVKRGACGSVYQGD